MSPALESLGINRLNLDDRLLLVQEIWDSMIDEVQRMPLTQAQKQELDRRLAAHEADPSKAVPWEEVQARAFKRLRP